MIAGEYLARSRLFRQLKNRSHEELIERYVARLVKDGLRQQGILRSLRLVGGLLKWIARSRSRLTDLDEGMVERFLSHRARKQFIQRGDRAALKRLLSVLRDVAGLSQSNCGPSSRVSGIVAPWTGPARRGADRCAVDVLANASRFYRRRGHCCLRLCSNRECLGAEVPELSTAATQVF